MKELTNRQKEILNFISTYRETTGFPPTLSEIAKNIGISCPTVSYHVKALEKKGKLSRMSSQSRSLVLKRQHPKNLRRCMAYIRDDFHTPLPADPCEEPFFVPDHMVEKCGEREVIAYRVQRDEMINLGIRKDDIIICFPITRDELAPGKMVIMERADGSTTLRMPVIDLENQKMRMCYSTYDGCWYFEYLRDDDRIKAQAVGLLRDL